MKGVRRDDVVCQLQSDMIHMLWVSSKKRAGLPDFIFIHGSDNDNGK